MKNTIFLFLLLLCGSTMQAQSPDSLAASMPVVAPNRPAAPKPVPLAVVTDTVSPVQILVSRRVFAGTRTKRGLLVRKIQLYNDGSGAETARFVINAKGRTVDDVWALLPDPTRDKYGRRTKATKPK